MKLKWRKHWEKEQESERETEEERERPRGGTEREVCGQIKALLYQDSSPRFIISHFQKRDSGSEPSQEDRGERTVCRRGKLGYWQEIGIINPHFMNSPARAMTALAFWLSITRCTCIICTEMCKTCRGEISLKVSCSPGSKLPNHVQSLHPRCYTHTQEHRHTQTREWQTGY